MSTVDVINIAADRQKFMTLTGELVDSAWDDQSFQRYGCAPKFKWSTWLNHAPFRDVLPSTCYQLLPTIHLPNLKSLSPLTTKIWKTIQNVEMGWF